MGAAPISRGQVKRMLNALTPGDLSRNPYTGFLGDSITLGNGGVGLYGFGGQAYPTVLSLLSGGKIRILVNAGVSGQTSAQILARVQTDIIQVLPKVGKCFVLAGTNDLPAVALATSVANIAAIYDQLRAAGIEPIGLTVPPSATQSHAKIGQLNAAIKRLCDARGMHCLDIHTSLVDPAVGANQGKYLAGYSADGVHPGPAAVRVIAGLAASALNPTLRLTAPYLVHNNDDGINLITNGLFLGDVNADGIADNWNASSLTGVVTPSLVTGDPNILGNWQRQAITTAGSQIITQTINPALASPLGWAVGDVLEFACLFSTIVEAAAAAPTVRVHMSNSTGFGDALAFYAGGVDVTRGVIFMRFVVQPGTTILSPQLLASEASPRTNGGTATIDTAQVSMVNLTRLGVA